MKQNSNNQEATPIVAQNPQPRKTFDEAKRDFETAYSTGDYSASLMQLAQAIASACLNKCIDPQRTTAPTRDTVSNNGINPALLALRRGMHHDIHLLANVATAADDATAITTTADGDLARKTADHDALTAFGTLIGDTLSDGIDLVQTAATALLEQAASYAAIGDKWLDMPYTVTRLAKKVYIQDTDSAAYREEETTPIQEVYRAVRRAIQSSRAAQTDPRNGYTYIEDLTPDGLDTIYLRLDKYADLGGYDCNGHYTAEAQTVREYHEVMRALNLTSRQITIVSLRMRGYGYKAIAAYLGVDTKAIHNVLARVQAKCEKIGFTPDKWREDDTDNNEND